MFVKRYIASDMSEAMEKIRKELGPEAVILSHRTMRKKGLSGFMKKRLVEVMVAYEPVPDRKIGVDSLPVQTVAEPALIQEALPRQNGQQLRKAAIQEGPVVLPLPLRQDAAAQRLPPTELPPTELPPMQPAANVQATPPAAQAQRNGAPLPQAENAPAAIRKPEWPRQSGDMMQNMLSYQQVAAAARRGAAQEAPPGSAPPMVAEAAPYAGAPAGMPADLPADLSAEPHAGAPQPAEYAPYAEHNLQAATQAPATQEAAQSAEESEHFEEITFPRLKALDNMAERAAEAPATPHSSNDARIDALNARLAELQNIVRELTSKIITADKESLLQFSPAVMRIYNRLLEQDVQDELAMSISEHVQAATENGAGDALDLTRKLIDKLLGSPSPIALRKSGQTVVLLTGPTGVGKTTTLVKLAGMFSIREGVRIGFINTDTYRVAAQEQLRVYANIMDIPCITVYTPEELPMALHALSDCQLVLIDTAGKSTRDQLYRDELDSLIAHSNAQDVLLHISASMSANACRELIRYYSFLKQYKIVVTKLDEVAAYGNLLNIAAQAKRPLAFLTTGQKVPQDIEDPNTARITEQILGGSNV